jgi:carboxyl-terminal processing protease
MAQAGWIRKFARAAAFVCAAAPLAADDDPGEALAREIKRIVEVYSLAEAESADRVDPTVAFFQGAIPAMLRRLDPHSIFFDPDQFAQLQRMERSEQKGFGTIVNVLPGRVMILQAMPGSPAAKAGLAAGDEILAVNKVPLALLEFDQILELLGIARQKEVTLHVRHPGETRVVEVTMSPAVVDTPSVDRAFTLAPRVGYLRIAAFEGQTGVLVKQTIEKLGGEYLRSLIVDLRDNPGGDVQAALETAALFLSPDQIVFSIRGRSKEKEEVRVSRLAAPYTFPVAVLMNAKSASAAEIVAGALQDHDRAVIVGEPSFGKGLVQQVYPLSGNSGLALTTAFYFTPSGRSIQKPLRGGQLDAATAVEQGPFRTDSGRQVRGGGGIQPDEVVLPEAPPRLRAVLDATGLLTVFASGYARDHEIAEHLEISPALLDELRLFLSERSIQPSVGDWLSQREWISSRLKQELFNVKFGVARGDRLEVERDPVVKAALKKIGAAP